MPLKDTSNVPGRPTGVVGQRHGRAVEDVEIRDNAAAGQPVAEPTEGILDGSPIEQVPAGRGRGR